MRERPRTPVKDRALRLLGVRSRSREELRRRLHQAGYEDDEVREALEDLEAVGLIDDERFARELAAHEIGRRQAGRRAALAALRQKGVGAEVAERTVSELDPGDEEERAVEVARTRVTRMGSLDPQVAYRRLLGFLQRRGYGAGVAHAACRRVLEERGADIR
jgi:regulatory protein